MYKAIVFDMDGTLLNSDEMVLNIYKDITQKYPPCIRLETIEKDDLLSKSYKEILLKLYERPIDDLLTEIEKLFHQYKHHIKLFPGTKTFLSHLKKKGYLLGLLTSEMKNIAYDELKTMHIFECFDIIITSDDVDHPKPHIEGLIKILDFLKVNPKALLYIGDQTSDGLTGQKASIQTGLMARKKSKRYIDTFFDYTFQSYNDVLYHLNRFDSPLQLTVKNDKPFKILQLTDLHLMNDEKDHQTFRLIHHMIKQCSPDFIIYTGDQTMSLHSLKLYKDLSLFTDQYGIKYSYVFGNHDTEHGVTHESINQVMSSSKNLLFKSCPKKIGYSNMHVEVLDACGHLEYLIISLDSHIDQFYYINGQKEWGYSEINDHQIDWYRHLIRYYTYTYNRVIPSVLFLHIPIHEYRDVDQSHSSYQGLFLEGPSTPPVRNTFFENIKSLGSTKAIFCGHDHYNDYQFEKNGILLAYGRVSGYYEYGAPGFDKGARIIELFDDKILTYIKLMKA